MSESQIGFLWKLKIRLLEALFIAYNIFVLNWLISFYRFFISLSLSMNGIIYYSCNAPMKFIVENQMKRLSVFRMQHANYISYHIFMCSYALLFVLGMFWNMKIQLSGTIENDITILINISHMTHTRTFTQTYNTGHISLMCNICVYRLVAGHCCVLVLCHILCIIWVFACFFLFSYLSCIFCTQSCFATELLQLKNMVTFWNVPKFCFIHRHQCHTLG